jgi:hypothetical protein
VSFNPIINLMQHNVVAWFKCVIVGDRCRKRSFGIVEVTSGLALAKLLSLTSKSRTKSFLPDLSRLDCENVEV